MKATTWTTIQRLAAAAGARITQDAARGLFILTLASGMTVTLDQDTVLDRFLITNDI